MAYGKIDEKLAGASAELSYETALVLQRMSKDLDDLVNIVTQLTRRVEKLERGATPANADKEKANNA